jgi:ABC-type uncharacterized transport system permease subunit
MDWLALTLAAILSAGTPLVLATLGETLTERAGVINLSLDGSILLAAMAAFAVSYSTGSPWLGFIVAALVGAMIAGILALVGLIWGAGQLAVGFILTLLCRDLAYFLGNPFARQVGPELSPWVIPGLGQVPFLGPFIGRHSPVVYISLAFILLSWWYLYYTRYGLNLRAVGESPRAAYGRGLSVPKLKVLYTLAGGAMVGMAGAAFSLAVKPGWGRPQGCEGTGWICLAIVIFGGWSPVGAALGAYFFAFLQVAGVHLQDMFPNLPAPLFQVAPFPVMILTLLVVNLGQAEWTKKFFFRYPVLKRILTKWQSAAPAALGKDFRPEEEL